MRMMTTLPITCRILDHGPLSGEENMAIDAEMLERAVAGEASLRTYQWSQPTISLGHFQVSTTVEIPERFKALATVKRLSGGGAILHDQELTYSLALPKFHRLTATPSRIYNEVHQCIIHILNEHGIEAHMRGDSEFDDKSFLCFLREDERDIVIGNHKIVGSAQRRRQGAVLQHGSLLLRQSLHTPEFPGILELTQKDVIAEEFVLKFHTSICEQFGLRAELSLS